MNETYIPYKGLLDRERMDQKNTTVRATAVYTGCKVTDRVCWLSCCRIEMLNVTYRRSLETTYNISRCSKGLGGQN